MAFYVPLGPRGILFRIGTALIGLIGSTIYRQGRRRRRDQQRTPVIPPSAPPTTTS